MACPGVPGRGLWVAVGVLYAIALLGDSYYGLTAQIAPLASLYAAGFHLFSYTRNGLLMAPSSCSWVPRWASGGPPLPWAAGLGLALSLALMTGEGFLLRHLGLQRHDSMYLLLPLVMCFLYRLLLAGLPRPRRPAGPCPPGCISSTPPCWWSSGAGPRWWGSPRFWWATAWSST